MKARAGFILLMLFAKYALGYDAFHKNGRRIYRAGQFPADRSVGGSNLLAETSGVPAPTLKREFPEIEAAVALSPGS